MYLENIFIKDSSWQERDTAVESSNKPTETFMMDNGQTALKMVMGHTSMQLLESFTVENGDKVERRVKASSNFPKSSTISAFL